MRMEYPPSNPARAEEEFDRQVLAGDNNMNTLVMGDYRLPVVPAVIRENFFTCSAIPTEAKQAPCIIRKGQG